MQTQTHKTTAYQSAYLIKNLVKSDRLVFEIKGDVVMCEVKNGTVLIANSFAANLHEAAMQVVNNMIDKNIVDLDNLIIKGIQFH